MCLSQCTPSTSSWHCCLLRVSTDVFAIQLLDSVGCGYDFGSEGRTRGAWDVRRQKPGHIAACTSGACYFRGERSLS